MMCSPPQCAARTTLRGDETAGKRNHRNRSSSPERVRLLQPLIPRPQKRRRPATYSRSQTPKLRPDEKVVQDDMPRGLVHVAGSERRALSHPGSPPSQMILEIRIRRDGISIQVLPFGLSLAPRTLTRCIDAALSPLRQMGICILNYLDGIRHHAN